MCEITLYNLYNMNKFTIIFERKQTKDLKEMILYGFVLKHA